MKLSGTGSVRILNVGSDLDYRFLSDEPSINFHIFLTNSLELQLQETIQMAA